jgi:hypothetical protein
MWAISTPEAESATSSTAYNATLRRASQILSVADQGWNFGAERSGQLTDSRSMGMHVSSIEGRPIMLIDAAVPVFGDEHHRHGHRALSFAG